MSALGAPPQGSIDVNARFHQSASHAALARQTDHDQTCQGRHAPLNAIIVPAYRGAHTLDSSIRLAASLQIPLVVLCSGAALAADVIARAESSTRSGVLAVDVPAGYRHDLLPAATSLPRFQVASALRHNDLSLKRNLGLLLARLLGWSKVLFVDDDIRGVPRSVGETLTPAVATRIAAHLDDFQVAGMVCRDYPDNSVVCHARRLAGLPQDNFVSGAVLGVNCSDQPLPFFPDIYNEDWFFFARPAANRALAQVGEARQDPHDPYDPRRAQTEEFGDLLAEGLFTLFESQPADMPFPDRLTHAHHSFWAEFMEARAATVDDTTSRLTRREEGAAIADPASSRAAVACMDVARRQLDLLTPALCVDFVQAWQCDLHAWEQHYQRLRSVAGMSNALAELNLHGSYAALDRVA